MEGFTSLVVFLLFTGYFVTKVESKVTPPKIHIKGEEIIVDSQHNLTILCEGFEPITWTYPNNTLEGTFWSTVNVEISQTSYKYLAKLTLFNASYVDVGYFYCHGISSSKNDHKRSSKIYVYVRDENHLSVSPTEEIVFISTTHHSNVTLPCRPTSPDVSVTLYDINGEEANQSFDPKIGYNLLVKSLLSAGDYKCVYELNDKQEEQTFLLHVSPNPEYAPKPIIEAPNNGRTQIGQNYTLNCSIIVDLNVYFILNWTVPDEAGFASGRIHSTDASSTVDGDQKRGSSILTITNITPKDQGIYNCKVTDHSNNTNNAAKNITVFNEGGSYINLQEKHNMSTINTTAGSFSVQWVIVIDSYPSAEILWLDTKGEEIHWLRNSKYSYEFNKINNMATFKINQITLNDSGVYQLIAFNGKSSKTLNLTLVVQDKPTVHIISQNYQKYGEEVTITCIAAGYPIPTVEWFFQPCQDNSCHFEVLPKNMYMNKIIGLSRESTLKMNATVTGYIRCSGNNSLDSDSSTQGFYVTDVNKGFDIWGLENNLEVAAGSTIHVHCGVSVYNYTKDVNWYIEKENDNKLITSNKQFVIRKNTTDFTYRTSLTINSISKNHSGNYICVAKSLETDLEQFQYMKIIVKDPTKPKIVSSNMNGSTIGLKPWERLKLICAASGIPFPNIIWTIDGHDWARRANLSHVKLSANNTVLEFSYLQEDDAGLYTCKAINSEGYDEKSTKLEIVGSNKSSWTTYLTLIIIFLAIFVFVIVAILCVKIRKEKKLQRELKIAGLAKFEKGELESLNPELGIDDQAELLPYDKKWEFPRDKLKLGKQLGSGAFGVVMKAEAFGLVEGEDVTTVAVKMVKRNADYTYIKALASELKIMVHLGKHLNVVNLLGACTKNVTKRELLVLVEYCRFGNLHNYLLRHRDEFVNQIDLKSGTIDTNIGAEFLNRTMSVGSNQSQNKTMAFAGVDYRLTPNPSSTTDSSICTPTGDDTMILSNNSVQPEWRSNYKGDYKGNVRPTSTHDLLCWAFQVARGMEYLASRKVLHGDLAARNILLAEDNIVKICDFGLAKSMYKSDNYKKKGDGPLPVKWMAVESIRDRVFSTQSDVWSFGIVLWEFFSLAHTPYPGMDADERLYNKLVDGYRMDQPEYATKEIYQIMMECWHAKPVYRPSFTKLAEDLGNMLQDTVRKHYIDLNDPYLMLNKETMEGRSDYLAMLSPPDYGNLASPTHEYVNGNPVSENQTAEASGYLPMDIFSPRSNDGSIFDFEVQKNKKANNEPATGVELLPMLDTNVNSESDNELSPTSPSNSQSFSNPNYQPASKVDSNKINEPKKDNIVSTSDNYINMPQQKSAIKNISDSFSNPSYIQMNNKSMIHEDNEKNNYVNNHSRDWERPV